MTPIDSIFSGVIRFPIINIVDAGAAPIDGDPPWQKLFDRRRCRVIGFEPDPDMYVLAKEREIPGFYKVLNAGIGGKAESCTLHRYHAPGLNSVHRLGLNCGFFHHFDIWGKEVGTSEISIMPLDILLPKSMNNVDLIKMDIQGSELEALKGAELTLRKAMAVQIEAPIVPLYFKQKSFGAIDEVLSKQFMLHHFHEVRERPMRPLMVGSSPSLPDFNPQLFEIDMVYFKSIKKLTDAVALDKLLSLCVIAHDIYNAYDFVGMVLNNIDLRFGKNLLERYVLFLREGFE